MPRVARVGLMIAVVAVDRTQAATASQAGIRLQDE
jgi:hypothetical protein